MKKILLTSILFMLQLLTQIHSADRPCNSVIMEIANLTPNHCILQSVIQSLETATLPNGSTVPLIIPSQSGEKFILSAKNKTFFSKKPFEIDETFTYKCGLDYFSVRIVYKGCYSIPQLYYKKTNNITTAVHNIITDDVGPAIVQYTVSSVE